MTAFPTLTAKPLATNWIELPSSDSTIRSETDGGITLSRARFTSKLKKWNINYPIISQADKILLENFERTINFGADSFTWTNPQDSLIYEVRLELFIELSILNDPDKWGAEFVLVEAYPNSSNSLLVETIIAANYNVSSSEVTLVGRILSTGNQVDGSDLSLYFKYGSDVSVPTSTASTVLSVSDIDMNAVPPVFALDSNILHSVKNLYYQAVAEAKDGSLLGYGEIKSVTSDHLGY